jgi:hypothetical protein
MKKLVIPITLLALYLTNPTKADYIDYAKTNILGHTPSMLVSAITDPLIDRTTTRQDYLIGSVYTNTANGVKTLGIAKKFVPMSEIW